MKVVFLSHTADHTTFKVGSHHYARELGKLGWDVLHVSTPHSRWLGRFQSNDGQRRALAKTSPYSADGVVHIVPTQNLPLTLSHRWADLWPQVEQLGFGDSDVVMVDQPLMYRSIPPRGSAKIVYRPTDVYSHGAYVGAQRKVLERSDAVVGTSPGVVEALGLPADMRSTVIENGVSLGDFAATDAKIPRSGAVYVGSLDSRFDWDALGVVADSTQAIGGGAVRVFGPPPRSTMALRNVVFEGQVAYEELPAVLHAARVGLMPFIDSRVNRGRSPMKLYEYLAAGLNVVAPDFMCRVPSGLAHHVFGYASASDIPEALAAAMAAPPVGREGFGQLAESDWAAKALELQRFVLAI